MNSKYLLYTLPALLLAACSNEDPTPGITADGAAVVTADISGIAKSRAHDSSWDAGDQIGISGTTRTVNYVNVPYTTTGDGSFSASNGIAKGIFFQNKETATFSAYYPYNSAVTADNAEIAANTSDQSKSKEFDFLFASGATGSVTNPAIKFTDEAAFSHRMTQLVIKVTPDENSGFDASTALSDGTGTLSGLKSEGSFDTASGLASATGDASDWTLNGNVTPTVDGTTLTFAMILFPQESIDGVTYRIDYDGAAYSCTLNPELAAGKRYTYNVTLKKTGLTVVSSVITDWEDEPAQDIDADMKPYDPFNGHEAVLMRAATETEPALYFATCNIGASTPYEVGLYFWWGDVEGHELNDSFDFQYGNPLIATSGVDISQLYSNGVVTSPDASNSVLTPQYDAAQVKWGSGWRMPTKAELTWLNSDSNCTWTWREQADGSPEGFLITSKSTLNSIFLPVTGHRYSNVLENKNNGYYYSSTPTGTYYYSYYLNFDKQYGRYVMNGANYGGNAIRPVHD